MAFIHPRRGGKIYAYYHDRATGKLRQVPRALTSHLDGQPLDRAEHWLKNWEAKHGRVVDRSERVNLAEGDKLSQLWRAYQAQQESDSDRGRRAKTLRNENGNFYNDIVPFFVGKHGKKLPTQWHPLIPDFHAHLAARELAAATRQKILWTLSRFGVYLVFSQYMTFPFVVRPPRSKNSKITPLKVRLTPEEVLACKGDFRLAVLLGYFGGLAPSELFALNKADLITGKDAEKTKTYEGFKKHDLGSRLAVSVSKSFELEKVVELTKNDHRTGMVTVWHPKAAKEIALLAKELPEGRIFPLALSTMQHLWSRKVKLGCTPHDLRRASCLYLGRTLRLPPTLIQEHMRHAELDTTLTYMREPAIPDAPKKKRVQDFDDVA